MGIPLLIALGAALIGFAGCSSRKGKAVEEYEEELPDYIKPDPEFESRVRLCMVVSDDPIKVNQCTYAAYATRPDKYGVFRVGPSNGKHFYVVDSLRDLLMSQMSSNRGATQGLAKLQNSMVVTQDGEVYQTEPFSTAREELSPGDGFTLSGLLSALDKKGTFVGTKRIGYVDDLSRLWAVLNLMGTVTYPLLTRDIVIRGGLAYVNAPVSIEPETPYQLVGHMDKKDVDKVVEASRRGFEQGLVTMDAVFDKLDKAEIANLVKQNALKGQVVAADAKDPSKKLVLMEEVGPYGGFGDSGFTLAPGKDMGSIAQFWAENMPGTNAVIKDPQGNYRVYAVEGVMGDGASLETTPLPSEEVPDKTDPSKKAPVSYALTTLVGPDNFFEKRAARSFASFPEPDSAQKKDISLFLLNNALNKLIAFNRRTDEQKFLLALQPEVLALSTEPQRKALSLKIGEDVYVRKEVIASAEARDKLAKILKANPPPAPPAKK